MYTKGSTTDIRVFFAVGIRFLHEMYQTDLYKYKSSHGRFMIFMTGMKPIVVILRLINQKHNTYKVYATGIRP